MKHIAKSLASLGRGEDKMLVHMTPREVAGLQTIAMAHGGSLTTNPHTGLPEAGFLSSILPMIAGGIATMFTGPLGAALVGGATGAATGDKDQSLLMRAGLGALGGFGGAGIVQGLGAAGASAAGNTAATQLGNVGADLAKNAVGGVSEFVPTMTKIGGTAVDTLQASGLGGEAAKLMGQNALTGIGGVMSSGAPGQAARTAFMNTVPFGGYGVAAAGAPTIAEAMKTPEYGQPEDEPVKYKRTQYNLGDVNTTDDSKPYFGTQNFSPFEEYTLADGGEVPAGPPARNPALQGYLSSLHNKLTAMPTPVQAPAAPASQAPASTPDQAPNVANALRFGPFNFGGFNGMGSFFRPGMDSGSVKYDAATKRFSYAGGGGIAGLGAYSDGGRLLKGPGDGVSDDIPAVIHNSDGSEPQEARLADGEFVFPARIVSEIGNGSTEAGARKLYAIMDRIQKDRGRSLKNVAANTKADRHFEGLA